jgi:hypothetical protein
MMKNITILLLFLATQAVQGQEFKHGLMGQNTEGKVQVWDQNKTKWTDVQSFWINFAKSNEAKFWGETDTYPNYDDVKEFDMVLIQLNDGVCLMQFFHSRWRRANDVQRWDDAFNDFSGCASVFD